VYFTLAIFNDKNRLREIVGLGCRGYFLMKVAIATITSLRNGPMVLNFHAATHQGGHDATNLLVSLGAKN